MPTLTGEYFEVEAREGERWDLLAHDYLGSVRHQSVIIEANREAFLEPLNVPPLTIPRGTLIRIPVIEPDPVSDADLPPWKRSNPDYSDAD